MIAQAAAPWRLRFLRPVIRLIPEKLTHLPTGKGIIAHNDCGVNTFLYMLGELHLSKRR